MSVAANGLEVARVGYVTRDMRSAVARNRTRRRLRALLRPFLADLGGLDIIVTATPGCAVAPFGDLEGDLARCVAALRRRPGLAAAGCRPREPLSSSL